MATRREPKPTWVQALRALCGAGADLRFNESLSRWEFVIPGADGVPRSQFLGWWYRKNADGSRSPVTPDPATGMYPFRELDDETMREVLENLDRSFVGNPFNGAGTTQREVMRRYRFNRDLKAKRYREAGETWADMVLDRLPRMRGTQQIAVPVTLGGAKLEAEPAPTPKPTARSAA